MKKPYLYVIILFCMFCSYGYILADVHAKTEGSRMYMDFESKYAYELWMTEDKSYSMVMNRITIVREDLGVMWMVYPDRKSYREIKLDEARGGQEEEKENISTVGLFYNPEYDWVITDTGEEKEINGFRCHCFQVEGDADFSEIVSTYWICVDENVPGGKVFREYMMEQVRNDRQRPKLYDLMQKYGQGFPVYREEIIENAIAPTMFYKIQLTMLEEADPPPSTYELPEGCKKIER